MRVCDDPEMEQHPVEHAEGRVEHPLPGEGRQHGRDDEWQQDEGAHERLAAEMPVEQQRQPQPERQFEDRRDEGVEAGVVDRDVEDAVVPDLDEIVEADEMARHADLGIGDRQQDAVDERIGDEQPEQDHRRQHQAGRQPALVFEQAGDRPARWRADIFQAWGGNVDGRHERFLAAFFMATANGRGRQIF